MKLKSIEIDKRFVPEWNKNKDLPADEQVIIYFQRIPATSEISNYKSFSVGADSSLKLNYNDNTLAAAFISKIDNLEINDKKILNGKDLATASCPQLRNHPAAGTCRSARSA